MKDNLEKLKDVLYDFSDFIIMGGIVLSIVLIIGWRLDILFPKTTAMVDSNDLSTIEKEIEEPKNIEENTEEVKTIDDKEKVPETIKISIPKGSPSTSIANILVDKGLIESAADFEKTVGKLKLEKKLRSGEFEIRKEDSIETIAKIIANEN